MAADPIGFPDPSWLVGCGAMAGAMVEGWRRAGRDLSCVTAIRPSGTPVGGVGVARTLPDGPAPRFVLLGIKPQKLDEVAPGLAPMVHGDTILVSLLAGVEWASLRARFPAARAVVRAMPNLPVSEGEGIIALYSEDRDGDALGLVGALMEDLGSAPWCERESDFAAIGALASSGPAFVARFVAALGRGGEGLGLDPGLAAELALQTLIGTGALARASGADMAAIARRVASPGGTTEAGLAILDASDGLQPLLDRMLAAAIARGAELAASARPRG